MPRKPERTPRESLSRCKGVGMSVFEFAIVAALILAGWLIAHAINSGIQKGSDAIHELKEYFGRLNLLFVDHPEDRDSLAER